MGIAFFFFFSFLCKNATDWVYGFLYLATYRVHLSDFYIKSYVAATEYALLLSCLALYSVALSLLALLLWVRLHILGRNGKMGVLVLALIL